MSRRPLKLAALIAALFVLGACADGPTAPTESPNFQIDSGSTTQKCQTTQGVHDC